MGPNPEEVKEQLRTRGEEYHYRDEVCDIGGNKSGESSAHIEHFVVQRDSRGQNIATTLLTSLVEVLREDGIHTLTVKMGATECQDFDELDAMRDEHGSDWQDPTYQFLRTNGFQHLEYEMDWQWNLCVKGFKSI